MNILEINKKMGNLSKKKNLVKSNKKNKQKTKKSNENFRTEKI